jgi:hypothetical protein
MSKSYINFECNRCEYTGTSRVVWGNLAYLLNNIKIPINRELGYCIGCKALCAKERFDNDILTSKMQNISKIISEHQSLFRILIPSTKKSIADENAKLNAHRVLRGLLTSRSSEERCLNCASSKVIALENRYDLEYRKGFYLGVAMTGFKHPECGGEFIARGSDISLNIRFSERLYSPYGVSLY